MIRFFENHSLRSHNTFKIEAQARFYFEFTEVDELKHFIESGSCLRKNKTLIAGEGSNILFLSDFDGLVIHPKISGMRQVNEDSRNVWIEAGAGEIWDEFVNYCVGLQLGGIENLSLIPGTVGAAPVQNIGAYGQEVANVIERVRGFDLERNEEVEYSNRECCFGYRDSIFKRTLNNRFVITSVVFKLNKFPEYRLDYGNLKEQVNQRGGITLENIRYAINEIRMSKLPDVKELGSAGSFFKNPVISVRLAEELKTKYGEIPMYNASDGEVKIAAGWLVEQCGWKGFREGDVGVHGKQALVLVNYGNATGKEIFVLSERIMQTVLDKFGVELEREVNCI